MTLQSAKPPYVLLDDSREGEIAGRSLLFHTPDRIICTRAMEDVPLALARIDQAVADGFHVAGWIAYECAAAFEPRVARAVRQLPDEPLIWMMITRYREEVDADGARDWLSGVSQDDQAGGLFFDRHAMSLQAYREAVEKIGDYIVAGDIYQANFTFPRRCKYTGDAVSLYQRLRHEQPVEYGALIETGENTVLSLSPELFVRRLGDRVQTRPMKGTAARQAHVVEDREAAIALSADPKSRAENLMIVDLIRNDLSRISVPGTVRVKDLFTIETYPTLHQMTSGIEASCAEHLIPSALLAALFPCGSVTGAPKIRAMEIIAELEQGPRGIYCGAVGHFSPATGGEPVNWSLNVPIRTFIFDNNGRGRLAVGSGIVHDSVIEDEYRECLLKAGFAEKVLTPAPFYLIETMRFDHDRLLLKDRHLERVLKSARHFDIPVTKEHLDQALEKACEEAQELAPPHDSLCRVRLIVDQTARIETSVALVDNPRGHCRVGFARTRLASDDPWLRHKTSRRDLYDRASVAARNAGLADIVFLNEKDEIAEGAISSIFVETSTGWATPPLSSGVLPGVLRADLLADEKMQVRERQLTRDDLKTAHAVYIGNALRGLRRVEVVDMELDV